MVKRLVFVLVCLLFVFTEAELQNCTFPEKTEVQQQVREQIFCLECSGRDLLPLHEEFQQILNFVPGSNTSDAEEAEGEESDDECCEEIPER